MKDIYQIKSRFWITGQNGTYLGEGRVRLLQSIQETGSISAASKALEISYRKAWKMIDIMNAQAKNPLVEKQIGGKKGGGTIVTPAGEKAIDSFLALKAKCQDFMQQAFKEVEF